MLVLRRLEESGRISAWAQEALNAERDSMRDYHRSQDQIRNRIRRASMTVEERRAEWKAQQRARRARLKGEQR